MKFGTILSIAFVLVVSGVLIFNASGFGMMSHVLSAPCPVMTMTGGGCPVGNNLFALAIHHLSGVKTFTQTTVGIDGLNLLMSALSVIALLLFVFTKFFQQGIFQQKLYFQKSHAEQDNKLNSQKKLLRWLSIRNDAESL